MKSAGPVMATITPTRMLPARGDGGLIIQTTTATAAAAAKTMPVSLSVRACIYVLRNRQLSVGTSSAAITGQCALASIACHLVRPYSLVFTIGTGLRQT